MADGSGAAGLPSSNRGVSGFSEEGTSIGVCIDWLSASVDLFAVLAEQGAMPHAPASMGRKSLLDRLDSDEGENAPEVAAHVFAYFFAGTGLEIATEASKGRFYKHRVQITAPGGGYAGQIEVGSRQDERGSTNRKDGTVTARIELTGDGCKHYGNAGSGHAKRWLVLRAKLESVAGRLTRVDIAADDLTGKYPINVAQEWRETGEFDNRGQRPKAQLIDDCGSRDGKTFYIGSKKSEKFLRVYEKGRQLGDPDSDWTRYEGQFTASRRKELPLDMLRDPAAFLLGAYPVLSFIHAMMLRIDTTSAAMKATWTSCRKNLKRQYGATLAFIVGNTESDSALARVVRTLTSPKLPAWASKEAAKNWPEIVAVHVKVQTT